MGSITKLFDLYRYLCFIDYDLQRIEEDECFEYDDLSEDEYFEYACMLEDDYNELNKDLFMFNYYLNKD